MITSKRTEVRDANFKIGKGLNFKSTRKELEPVWKISPTYPGGVFKLIDESGIEYIGKFHSSTRIDDLNNFIATIILN